MDTNKMREEFAAWAAVNGIDVSVAIMHLTHPPKFARFANPEAQKALRVWEASRAVQVVTLPPLPAMPEPDEYATDDSHMDSYSAARRMRDACARAIEAAGGRVAP